MKIAVSKFPHKYKFYKQIALTKFFENKQIWPMNQRLRRQKFLSHHLLILHSLGALLYTNCTRRSLGGSRPSVVEHLDLNQREKQPYFFAFFRLLECSSWSTVLFIFWYPIHITFLL